MASSDATSKPKGFDRKVEVPGSLISTLASTCASNFCNTLHHLSGDEDQKYGIIFAQFEKRFLDWAAYLGVFAGGNGSLDHRLERHPQYRDLIVLLLDMLNVSLTQMMTEPSEPSSDESSDDEVDKRKIEAESIQKSITELDRLAIHIRQASTSSLDARVNVFEAKKPLEASSYGVKATLAVNGLYPEAPESLRRYLSKSMTQRYMRLLYWRSHDKKLRADCRNDKQRHEGLIQSPLQPPPLAFKTSSQPRQLVRDKAPVPLQASHSRVSADTSFLSGTRATELGSQFTMPSAKVKIPVRERAVSSTVLDTGAKYPSPPKFEDGEDRKPCPFCRKIFFKDDFMDNKWWRYHVNDDLIPFVCVSSSCMESPTFTGRMAWKGHIRQYHNGIWFQASKVDLPETPDSRIMDVCPLCCLPLAELVNLKASKSRASDSEITLTKAKSHSDNNGAPKTVRFDVSESELPVTVDTETPIRAQSAILLDHIADHLQFLALLTRRLSSEKLGEGGKETFASDQGLSSGQGPGRRSTLVDDLESAEGHETENSDIDISLDGARQTEVATGQAWQGVEEIELGEAIDWTIVATLHPTIEGDDKIEHMQKIRVERDSFLEAALDKALGSRHSRRRFLEMAAGSCKSITVETSMALERAGAVGHLIHFFAQEVPRSALHGFFQGLLASVHSETNFMLVDYCTEQVWDFRPYPDSQVPSGERLASRRVLFGLLAMLERPLDILKAIKDEISDMSIPLATRTLAQVFPTWNETEVSSFMRLQNQLHVLPGPRPPAEMSSTSLNNPGSETSDEPPNHQEQIDWHDVDPKPVNLSQLLQSNESNVENPFPARLVIAIDFGTIYSAVSYVSIPQGCPSESVGLSSIKSIGNFPDTQNLSTGDQMAVPTEVIYPLNRHFRDQDEILISGQDNSEHIGVKSTGAINVGHRPLQEMSRDTFMLEDDSSDQFLWGYQVHKAWAVPSTHQDPRNQPLARFKLLLDDSPRTAAIRAELNKTLSALKRKRIVKKPLHVIADFLTELLRHTQRELQREGFDNNYPREIVLCVPAIWTQKACRDMQGCLTEAMSRARFPGVDVQNNSIENLFIVSEPEAAASYILEACGEVRPGDTFVLLDAGGGTVDANTYLVSDDEPITLREERVRPGGGLHGSSFLGEDFRKYLMQRLSDETYLDQGSSTIKGVVESFMIDQFEYRIKRYYNCFDTMSRVHRYRIPNLRRNAEKEFEDGSILVPVLDLNRIFYRHLEGIGNIMEEQLVQALALGCKVEKVVLTGGFGTSVSLKRYLKDRLEAFCKTNDCSATLVNPGQGVGIINAVANGAVFRALNKDGGPERMARASYGIQRREHFRQYLEHEGLNPFYDRHDGLPYITKTVDWVLKREERVPSVWECQPFTCTHTFSLNEKYLICKEILYVSDHATRSHYRLSHPYNRDAECVGEIIIDCTFLREQGHIAPVDPITLDNGKKVGKRHYSVSFTMAIRVVDRHLECYAIHGQKIIKRCRISIASGFKPGVN